MKSLSTQLRSKLERAVVDARDKAERGPGGAGATGRPQAKSLCRHDGRPAGLAGQLRAKAKQLGDERQGNGEQEMYRLHRECAIRAVAPDAVRPVPGREPSSDAPGGVPVTLEECEELAAEQRTDGWTLAARYASKMLPQIFRPDDPLLKVTFAPEEKQALEDVLAALPVEVFTASDSLGWCYQFWQAERKERGQRSPATRSARMNCRPSRSCSPRTTWWTSCSDNTLGAWHAGKVLAANPKLAENAQSEDELRQAVALPGCPWKYLRFIKGKDGKWTPAAGTFDGWPKTAKELKCLDPCMGSGHFVVAMFERLVALRLAEEKLDEAAAVAAVIRDNLFGLEIDPRCTQIGAFNLALAAWRRVGHCKLPAMNLACSGLAPNTREADWLTIAGDNEKLQHGMERLYRLFQKAPVLGSLINPRAGEGDLLEAAFHELQPLLEKALAQETKDDTAHEMAVTARGLAKAAEILAGQFTLVATNVPYLGRGKQDEVLKDYCERVHPEAKADLATCFVERCLGFLRTRWQHCASYSAELALPGQLYETSRSSCLRQSKWNFVARLGPGAFRNDSVAKRERCSC